MNGLPSGKHTKSYWKLPFIVDLPIKNCDFPFHKKGMSSQPHWQTPSFFRGVGQPPTRLCCFLISVLAINSDTGKWPFLNGWFSIQTSISRGRYTTNQPVTWTYSIDSTTMGIRGRRDGHAFRWRQTFPDRWSDSHAGLAAKWLHFLRLQCSRTGVLLVEQSLRGWQKELQWEGETVQRQRGRPGPGDETQSKRGRGMDLLLEQWSSFLTGVELGKFFALVHGFISPGPHGRPSQGQICGSEFVNSEGAEQILRRFFYL